MVLNIVIEDRPIAITVPDSILVDARDFFARMDADMDQGWQMSREWVDRPTLLQRCQIAADRLNTAINNRNETMVTLMAGYILAHMPQVRAVHVNTDGEMQETTFE